MNRSAETTPCSTWTMAASSTGGGTPEPSRYDPRTPPPKAKRVRLDATHELPIPPEYRQLSYGDMATTIEFDIGFGSDSQLYTLHRSALCEVSPFFRMTFLGNSKEAREMKMTLPTTFCSIFETFVEWLYSRKLLINAMDGGLARIRGLRFLASLYIFADNYDVPQLKNDTMDVIISCVQEGYLLPGPEVINEVYDNLPEDSPLCRLLVNEYARTGQVLAGSSDDWPAGFVFKAFNATMRAIEGFSPLGRPTHDCTYHDHATEAERSACLVDG
ncbi:btb poz domain containing protein [Diplodia corticola]|uniref:Btb poz domain containing protein n=1 Tax=Diplodia corticola TaxID=236234 RepID=A0A1J9QSS2_9PEZI|nr:btb poz domain containing protein [Diplodia corticola]OJD31034.1 btb poz domain containing protein [Diplodia corticola]